MKYVEIHQPVIITSRAKTPEEAQYLIDELINRNQFDYNEDLPQLCLSPRIVDLTKLGKKRTAEHMRRAGILADINRQIEELDSEEP